MQNESGCAKISVLLGGIAALVTILMFATGRQSLPELIEKSATLSKPDEAVVSNQPTALSKPVTTASRVPPQVEEDAPTLYESPVTIVRPSNDDLVQLRSIWTLTTGTSLARTPGHQSDGVSVQPNDRWIWNTTWCATDSTILVDNLKAFSVTFFLDGTELSKTKIVEIDEPQTDEAGHEWSCHYWVTVAYNWKSGALVRLSIDHLFRYATFDGKNTFLPGSHVQELVVTIR